VLHDLNQAARYAHRMIALNDGRIVADGTPVEVLTPALLASVFNVHAHIITDPASRTPVCLPYANVEAEIPDPAAVTSGTGA
jgi:iron complex transport system ATP-binding protein